MNLREAVDLVLLHCGGGQLLDDAAVQRPEVETLLPEYLHQAFEAWYIRQLSLAKKAQTSFSLPPDIYNSYVVQAQKEGKKYFIDLPGKVMDFTGKPLIKKIALVTNGCEDMEIAVTSGFVESDLMPTATPVNNNGNTRLLLSHPTQCNLIVYAVLAINCMDQETMLPLPDGVAAQGIAACVQHFNPASPTEHVIDSSFVNNVQKDGQRP